MTEHVYVVARAGRCNGAALTVYSDALSAVAHAKEVADSGGWTESESPRQEADRLFEAFGHGDEDWIIVSQKRVQHASEAPQKFVVGTGGDQSEAAVAGAVTRFLDWQRRA